MKDINEIHFIHKTLNGSADPFEQEVADSVKEMQGQGNDVEFHFSTATGTAGVVFSAVLIGRK